MPAGAKEATTEELRKLLVTSSSFQCAKVGLVIAGEISLTAIQFNALTLAACEAIDIDLASMERSPTEGSYQNEDPAQRAIFYCFVLQQLCPRAAQNDRRSGGHQSRHQPLFHRPKRKTLRQAWGRSKHRRDHHYCGGARHARRQPAFDPRRRPGVYSRNIGRVAPVCSDLFLGERFSLLHRGAQGN